MIFRVVSFNFIKFVKLKVKNKKILFFIGDLVFFSGCTDDINLIGILSK